MRAEIKTAVATILKTDPTVTQEQADLALDILDADPLDAGTRLGTVRRVLDGATPPETQDPVCKRGEAAELLGVHVRTVDYYRRIGRLRPVMGSGSRVIGFERESVLQQLRGRRDRTCRV